MKGIVTIECLAFANNARDDEERTLLLIMANILKRLALESEEESAGQNANESTGGETEGQNERALA